MHVSANGVIPSTYFIVPAFSDQLRFSGSDPLSSVYNDNTVVLLKCYQPVEVLDSIIEPPQYKYITGG